MVHSPPSRRRSAFVRLSDVLLTVVAILAVSALVPACGGGGGNHGGAGTAAGAVPVQATRVR